MKDLTMTDIVTENVAWIAVSLQQKQGRTSRHGSLLLSQLFTVGGTNIVRPKHRSRSMAERVMLDSERQRAITLYRQLKTSQS